MIGSVYSKKYCHFFKSFDINHYICRENDIIDRMEKFNVSEYLRKEPFNIDEFLVLIGREELLSCEEEVALVEKAQQGDEEAMNTLLCANARFVTSLVRQYQNNGSTIQNLLKVAMCALQKAVLEYDVHNEDPLIKCAVPQMRMALEKM